MVLQPKRILWPTDFSDLSLHGARYARGFREQFGAALHVIHVITPPMPPDLAAAVPTEVPVEYGDDELVNTCRQRLQELVAAHFGGTDGVTLEVFLGHPWSGICTYAQDAEIDLLIVSTHGRTGLQHVLIGSTAERIVQHAPCPVLVIKNPERDFVSE